MLFVELAACSALVAETPARLSKIRLLSDCLGRMRPEEVAVAVPYLSGELPQGSIGVGWASLRNLPPSAAEPSMEVLDVHRAFGELAAATGAGSQARRRQELARLFGLATETERTFLLSLLAGELRQGALEGVMVEAVARAGGVPAGAVRRASMVWGDLGAVAAAALRGADLDAFRLTVLRPLQPMLAQTAEGVEDALGRISPASVEWKLDGARIQVHALDGEVRVFTRNLADVTARVPEIVERIASLPARSLILDGEAIALGADERPHPFQVTMGRFGTRLAGEDLRAMVPLSPYFFDCLHLDGEDLIDLAAAARSEALASAVPAGLRPPRIVTGDALEAARFLDDALRRGHEGVMVKSLDAPYEAGRRGAGWLKVKRAHTLDLVVLAAEWGHGRRRGWLSNLHLGAGDPSTGGFVMLGKTFKGMTDRMLAWQTERLLALETGREGITVFVRPELVVEVAFDGLQTSRRYPAGLALRFARIKGYRHDKGPQDADTIDTARAIHAGAAGGPPLA